ncbi:hypothetical protein [Streptomyces spectabilis]|uniref:Uncharacterized protein n=1 Tax=Streptomyces spectabilis TaxID=68270 RepID=A0A7W8B3D2_STRST|nr:hypothetical protein [Streptomyces spectabilis]MBB5109202.1 hypothetical protein [Streptomyces spectabilis]MCI3907758.1 hypothetical protein [Streptomyces spectabilis]GGV51343.1 hypothetical protein GCM10010245_80930 [Streptomyces spectabilis]
MQTPDPPAPSYAQPPRRRAYITGMHQLAAARQPGAPVRVYLSAPPAVQQRTGWPGRVDRIHAALPDGTELLHYRDVFDPAADYFKQWPPIADTLDGLIVIGVHRDRRRDPREQTLGPVARQELIHIVGAGKPVLLHSTTHGLVPVLDCRPRRTGEDPHQRLRLTIPPAWSANEPTLHAALTALTPKAADAPSQRGIDTGTGNERATDTQPNGDEPAPGVQRPRDPETDKTRATPPHLAHPFATPPR